jgi:hypothetical protein
VSEEGSAERFTRIPYAFLDDPAYEDVYADDTRFATWVRLWMAADNAWPAPAPIPRSVNAEAFDFLTKAGLVIVGRSDHYRMTGMDDMQVARPGRAGGRARAAISGRSRGRFTSGLDHADTSTLDQHADTSTLDQPSGSARHVTSLHSTSPAGVSEETLTTKRNGKEEATDPRSLTSEEYDASLLEKWQAKFGPEGAA